jgi:hypothetical protein
MIDNKNVAQAKNTHKTNLLLNVNHRLQIAKDKGDSKLISQLEAELKYLS